MSRNYKWEQCENRLAHPPHAEEDFSTVWFCEGLTGLQALAQHMGMKIR